MRHAWFSARKDYVTTWVEEPYANVHKFSFLLSYLLYFLRKVTLLLFSSPLVTGQPRQVARFPWCCHLGGCRVIISSILSQEALAPPRHATRPHSSPGIWKQIACDVHVSLLPSKSWSVSLSRSYLFICKDTRSWLTHRMSLIGLRGGLAGRGWWLGGHRVPEPHPLSWLCAECCMWDAENTGTNAALSLPWRACARPKMSSHSQTPNVSGLYF